MSKTLTYHTDPGHGWLQVSQTDLDDVGLSYTDFSSCSYTDSKFLFLEEDCDMAVFMLAFRAKHGKLPSINEIYADPCFVRDLPANDRVNPIKGEAQ